MQWAFLTAATLVLLREMSRPDLRDEELYRWSAEVALRFPELSDPQPATEVAKMA